MWQSFEHRKFPRLSVRCDISFEVHGERGVFSTMTQNIGAGGVSLVLDQDVPRSSRVNLELNLDDETIECVGKVVWSVEKKVLGAKKSAFDLGIEFMDIPPEDREKINRYIAKHSGSVKG